MRSLVFLIAFLYVLPTSDCPQGGSSSFSSTRKKGKVTIGKATTYLTSPMDKDGYVDYVHALNERMSKGIEPGKNANVHLWKALGPPFGPKAVPMSVYKLLGVLPLPAEGEYFVDLNKYVNEVRKKDLGSNAATIYDQYDLAIQRPWKAEQYPALAEWLKANDKPLRLALEASALPHYFSPVVTPLGSAKLLGSLAHQRREIGEALVVRALLRAGEGFTANAWWDLIGAHRLARLLGCGSTLIESTVGIVIDEVAYNGDLAFLHLTKPNLQQTQQYLKDLANLPGPAPISLNVDLQGRFMMLEMIQLIDRHGLDYLWQILFGDQRQRKPVPVDESVLDAIDWDPALQASNEWFDRFVAAMKHEHRRTREKALEPVLREFQQLAEKFLNSREPPPEFDNSKPAKVRGKVVGDIAISFFLPNIRKLQDASDTRMQVHDNVLIAFALAWYEREHGRVPDDINALSPKYLPTIPRDMFSEKPLVYRPRQTGYLLYSVGVNGRDEGGRGAKDHPRGDDLSVLMPLPQLSEERRER